MFRVGILNLPKILHELICENQVHDNDQMNYRETMANFLVHKTFENASVREIHSRKRQLIPFVQ